MGIISEFKEFALKGNMVDLAVGVVIGGAFGGVVNALVTDVMMPPLGLLTGGVDFSKQSILLRHEVKDAAGKVIVPALNLTYGLFLNTIINFLIVAIAIFIVIKLMNAAKRTPPPAPAAPPPPTREEELLGEIRDLLKARA